MQPKILVGCPTSFHKEYCLKEYAEIVKSLTYPNYDILLVDNSKDDNYLKKLKSLNLPAIKGPYFEGAIDRIITSRNILKEYAIKNNYDYLFSLEQDVIPPKDVIERLLQHKKEIISGVYFNEHKEKLIPLLAVDRKINNKLSYLPEEIALNSKELIRVDYCGLGCVLINKKILNQIKFRYEKEKSGFDDWWFCTDIKAKNIKIYVDLAIKCKHLIRNRPWQWNQIKLKNG